MYPTPTDVLTKSTPVPKAIDSLQHTLDSAISNGTLTGANTSFHIAVFSTDDTLFDFSYISPGSVDDLSSGDLDKNTLFRIGSIGKLLTVYSLLATTGVEHLNDPVTKWVPELAEAYYESQVDTAKWQDISIGALASHLAGVRDFSLADMAFIYNESSARDLGLPVLSKDEIPSCGTDVVIPACSRDEFFKQIQTLHPITSSFNTPIYSTVAFQILAYAMEGMTKMSFRELFESTLVHPLNLTRTFLTTPETLDGLSAFIPGDEIESFWKLDAGDATSSAGGLMFSTGSDLTIIGQSILKSSLLAPRVTRQWLKPTTHTADLRLAVGMPWEIIRTPVSTGGSSATRIVDLYTKNGGIGAYNTQFALSPDHGFGFAVLTAGPPPTTGRPDMRMAAMQQLNGLITEALLPAFEAAALEQAAANFAGTYVSARTNDSEPMLIHIVAGDGGLGLGVQNWTAGNLDLLKSYFAATAEISPDLVTGEPSLRLYPVNLHDDGRTAYRGVFEYEGSVGVFSTNETSPFGSHCAAWAAVSTPQYGNIGLDDFVFHVDETGRAIAVTARGARTELKLEDK